MKIETRDGNPAICSREYTVTFMRDRLLAVLQKGNFYYGMCLLGAVDTVSSADEDASPPEVEVTRSDAHEIEVEVRARSRLWQRRIHRYRFREEEIEYWTEVTGEGAIDRVYFFRGTFNGSEVASAPGFTRVFSPMPNFIEKQEFHANEYVSIGVANTPQVFAAVRAYAFAGAPLCFALHDGPGSPVLGVGVMARKGEHLFHSFEMNHLSESARNAPEPIIGTQAFSLAYEGHVRVETTWTSPRLLMRFAADPMSAVEQYVGSLRERGAVPKRSRPYPEWTRLPVYCTWHDQVALDFADKHQTAHSIAAAEGGKRSFSFCTQENCERWIERLKTHGVNPGTIIVDARWQAQCGDPVAHPQRFPDMRSFVEQRHADGMRVVLWHGAWHRDGVPDEECLRVAGKPVKTDPTSPAYRKRVRAFMRRLLSDEPGCYNADGLKVDCLTQTPIGLGVETHGGLAGIELLRALLELLSEEAHRVKADAAVGLYVALPYLADLCDFARIGDLYTLKADPLSAIEFRTRIMRMVMPDVAIDTDGAQRFNTVLPLRCVYQAQARAGVPCTYQAEWVGQFRDFMLPSVRQMQPDDYGPLRDSWEGYRARLRAQNAAPVAAQEHPAPALEETRE